MPEVDLRLAVSLVEETCLPFRDQWIKELRRGTLDAYMALLLSRLPHLQLLCLSNPFFQESSLIGLVIQSILCGPRSDWLTVDISGNLSELRRVNLLASHTCGLASAQAHLFPQPLGASTSWNLHSTAAYSSDTSHFLLHSQHNLCSLGPTSTRNLESVLPFFYLPSVQLLDISIEGSLVRPLPWRTTQPPSALSLPYLTHHHRRQNTRVVPRPNTRCCASPPLTRMAMAL